MFLMINLAGLRLRELEFQDWGRTHLMQYTREAHILNNVIQSTLVISKFKGPSETLRDIRTYIKVTTKVVMPYQIGD